MSVSPTEPPEENPVAAPDRAAPGGDAAADLDELARLRSELAALRAQVNVRRRPAAAMDAVKRGAAAALIALAGFGFVASVVGLWAATTTLNTDRWVATVAPLPKNPQIAAAMTQYTTSEVFQVLNVEQRLRTVLPEQAAFVVGPLAGQVRAYVQRTVNTFVQTDTFQRIWIAANRRAHQQALAILEGRSDVVTVRGSEVSVDLLPLINQVLHELSARLPTLFGHRISLPDLSSGAVPANLRARLGKALGISLPANFAQLTFYDGNRLHAMQQALLTFKRFLAALIVGTVALIGLAFWISPGRRRTALQLGVWLVIAAIAVTAILRAVRAQLVAQVPGGVYRDGVAAAVTIVTGTLRQRGVQVIWLGVVLAVIAYLVGPGRLPVRLRRTVAKTTRTVGRAARRLARRTVARGPAWTADHLDAIRITGVVVAGVVALVLSSWTGLLVTAIALAAYEILATVVARIARKTATVSARESAA